MNPCCRHCTQWAPYHHPDGTCSYSAGYCSVRRKRTAWRDWCSEFDAEQTELEEKPNADGEKETGH